MGRSVFVLLVVILGLSLSQTGCINLVWSPSRCHCNDGKCCGEPPLAISVGSPPALTPTAATTPPSQEKG